MQCTAGIAVEIEGVIQFAIRYALRLMEVMAAQEAFTLAGIAFDLCASQAEETLTAVFAISFVPLFRNLPLRMTIA